MYKFFVLLFLIFCSSALFSDSTVADTKTTTSFIEVSNIPSSTTEIFTDLNKISLLIQEQDEISNINRELPVYINSINLMLKDSTNKYLEYLSLKELFNKEEEWKLHISQLSKWNETLEAKIELLDTNRVILNNYYTLWNETLKNAKKELAPKAILDNTSNIIKKISELKKKAKSRYDLILTSSNMINNKILDLNGILIETQTAISNVSNDVFHKNSLSLISLFSEKSFSPFAYVSSAVRATIEMKDDFFNYYADNSSRVFIFGFFSLFIIFFVFTFNYLYRKKTLFIKKESYLKIKYSFISLPFATSFILVALLNAILFGDIPSSVEQFQLLFIYIVVFYIFTKLLPKEYYKYFYIYIILYFASVLENSTNGFELDDRILSILLSLSLLIYIVSIIKKRVFNQLFGPLVLKFIYKLAFIYILLLSIALISDIYGATLLSSKITYGVFVSISAAVIFYVLTVILTGYIIILLRRRISSAPLHMEKFTLNIEKTTTLIVKLFMLVWWFVVVMKQLSIYKYFTEVQEYFMSLSWSIGSANISIVSVSDFIFIIAGTWFLVKLINIVLEVEVFSRFSLPRGLPTVITTVLNYFLTISGGLIALFSLGITVEQFTLVFGALGVGIGFGLRNIIANFISGIIMVFERPIQIGDTIEINDTIGTVQAIQTRSSIIKTFDGSEVIIPNADFIAKEITNWTLSDERRRKTLLFKVDSESDIDEVLAIMKSVVFKHPDVLKEPEPMAAFLGFGEYYLEFKLYFWLNENLIMAQSDIAIAIYKTLKEHNIKMPTPKHEYLSNKEEVKE